MESIIENFVFYCNFWHFPKIIIPKIGSIPPLSLLNLLDNFIDYQYLRTADLELGEATRKIEMKIKYKIKSIIGHSHGC